MTGDALGGSMIDAVLRLQYRVRSLGLPVPESLARDLRWVRILKEYNPDQPRDPVGTPTGGQWSARGGTGFRRVAGPLPPYLDLGASITDITAQLAGAIPSRIMPVDEIVPVRENGFGFGWIAPDGVAIVADDSQIAITHADWAGGDRSYSGLLDRGFLRFACNVPFGEFSFEMRGELRDGVKSGLRDLLIRHPEWVVHFDNPDEVYTSRTFGMGNRRRLERLLDMEEEKAARSSDPLDEARLAAEDQIAAALRLYFGGQWRRIYRQLSAARARMLAARLRREALDLFIGLEWEYEYEHLAMHLAPVLESAMSEAARLVWGQLQSLGVRSTWDIYDADAQAWANTYRYDLIRDLTDATREQLGKTISRWITTEEDFGTLVEQVRAIVPTSPHPVLRDRARLIAQTETTRIYAVSRDLALRVAGLRMYTWQTANDELVCPKCGPLHGKTGYIGQGVLNEDDGQLYDQPAHPGCRCWKTAAVAELEDRVQAKMAAPEGVVPGNRGGYDPYRDAKGRWAKKPSGADGEPAVSRAKFPNRNYRGTPLHVVARIGRGVCQSMLLEDEEGSRFVWKGLNSDKEQFHSGETEVLAYRLSILLGLDCVPNTQFYNLNGRDGTVQKFVRGELGATYCQTMQEDVGEEEVFVASDTLTVDDVVALDAIMGNYDRHEGNWLVDSDFEVVAIDHGHASWEEGRGGGEFPCLAYNTLLHNPFGGYESGRYVIDAMRIERWSKITRTQFLEVFKDMPKVDRSRVNPEAAWNNLQDIVASDGILYWESPEEYPSIDEIEDLYINDDPYD